MKFLEPFDCVWAFFLPRWSVEGSGQSVCLRAHLSLSHSVQEGPARNSRDLQTSFLLGAHDSGRGVALKGV